MSRLFVGISIPTEAALRVRLSSRKFRERIAERLPSHRWHITLFFLGEVGSVDQYTQALLAPIVSSFVPTVRLTHIGRGLARGQLWVYVEPNPQLFYLHRTLKQRAHALGISPAEADTNRTFVPHIHIAQLKEEVAGTKLPDWPLLTTFSAREAHLFESSVVDGERRYSVVGTLPLAAQEPVKK